MSNEVIQRRCRRSPTGIEDCFGSTGGTGSTGDLGSTTSLVQISSDAEDVNSIPPNTQTELIMSVTDIQSGSDLVANNANNSIDILTAGFYQVVHGIAWEDASVNTVDRRSRAFVDGAAFEGLALKANDAIESFEGSFIQYSFFDVGAVITLEAEHDDDENISVTFARLTVLGPL